MTKNKISGSVLDLLIFRIKKEENIIQKKKKMFRLPAELIEMRFSPIILDSSDHFHTTLIVRIDTLYPCVGTIKWHT